MITIMIFNCECTIGPGKLPGQEYDNMGGHQRAEYGRAWLLGGFKLRGQWESVMQIHIHFAVRVSGFKPQRRGLVLRVAWCSQRVHQRPRTQFVSNFLHTMDAAGNHAMTDMT